MSALAPTLTRSLTMQDYMYNLKLGTIIAKSFNDTCYLYWKGVCDIKSKSFLSVDDMNKFIEQNNLFH